jgi:hypothetical protein
MWSFQGFSLSTQETGVFPSIIIYSYHFHEVFHQTYFLWHVFQVHIILRSDLFPRSSNQTSVHISQFSMSCPSKFEFNCIKWQENVGLLIVYLSPFAPVSSVLGQNTPLSVFFSNTWYDFCRNHSDAQHSVYPLALQFWNPWQQSAAGNYIMRSLIFTLHQLLLGW